MANREYTLTLNNNFNEAMLTFKPYNEADAEIEYCNKLGREVNKSIKLMSNWSSAKIKLDCIEDKSVEPTCVLSADDRSDDVYITDTTDVIGTNPAIKLGIRVDGLMDDWYYTNANTIKLTVTNGNDTIEYSGAKELITEFNIAGAETSIDSGDNGDITWNGSKLSVIGSSIGTFEYTDSTGTHTGDIDSQTVMKSLVDKAFEIYNNNGGTVKLNLSATTTPVLMDNRSGLNMFVCKKYKQVYSGVGVDGDEASYVGGRAYQVVDNIQDINVENKIEVGMGGTIIDFTSAVSATTKYLAIINYNDISEITVKNNDVTVEDEVVSIFEITYTPA